MAACTSGSEECVRLLLDAPGGREVQHLRQALLTPPANSENPVPCATLLLRAMKEQLPADKSSRKMLEGTLKSVLFAAIERNQSQLLALLLHTGTDTNFAVVRHDGA